MARKATKKPVAPETEAQRLARVQRWCRALGFAVPVRLPKRRV
jgi:hypothetical protein